MNSYMITIKELKNIFREGNKYTFIKRIDNFNFAYLDLCIYEPLIYDSGNIIYNHIFKESYDDSNHTIEFKEINDIFFNNTNDYDLVNFKLINNNEEEINLLIKEIHNYHDDFIDIEFEEIYD